MATKKDAAYFTELLLKIYPCKVPFELRILHTKPKQKIGSYWPHNRHILINDKRMTMDDARCTEVAIHEYAHHLHYTEFKKVERQQQPHGPQFWMIYGQLMARAKALGLYDSPVLPVLEAPEVPDLQCLTCETDA